MKVMLLPVQRGIWRSVDTTGKRACETPIHSLRGRLATLLQIPVTLLSCFVVKFISWVLVQEIIQGTQNQISFFRWVTLLITALLLFWPVSMMAVTTTEIEQWLQAHNNYRILHRVPVVTWSKKVAVSAQAYADTCPSSHSGSGYGENIASATYDMGVSSVVQMWYDEESNYDYNNPGFSSESGHFTQIVWKATTQIGCAHATGCSSGMPDVWVCQYIPPGNYIGQFGENVFPPNFE